MTNEPDTITLKLSNAARMVLNALATEVVPLTDPETYLDGCDLVAALQAIPNTLTIGDKVIDIPSSMESVMALQPNDPQRIGVEELAKKWQGIVQEIKLPATAATVLILQMRWTLDRQGDRSTATRLPLTAVCRELVAAICDLQVK